MATSRKLSITYLDTEGKSKTLSYGQIKNGLTAATVKTLCTTLMTNGSIFASIPFSIKSAKTIVQTEEEIDINE